MHKRKELSSQSIVLFLGWNIWEDQLSGVLADTDDYLPEDIRAKCKQVMADPLVLDVAYFTSAFSFLKENADL